MKLPRGVSGDRLIRVLERLSTDVRNYSDVFSSGFGG
jgi:hypothetical protein